MSIMHSLAERFFYTNRRTYSDRQGNVSYLDGAPLRRPFELPASSRVFVALIVLAAVLIGGFFVNSTVLASMRESAAAEQSIRDNLAREASIDALPKIESLVGLNDKGIVEELEGQGFTMFDATSLNDSEDMILYRVPSDMTVDEAAELYAKGISALSAVDATKLLNGSWQLVAERSDVTSVVVRYADFSTADPEEALQRAMEKTGFDPEGITDSGVDDSGNTYNIGTLKVDDSTCSWKVSTLPLSEMFSISGVPEDACYVGIRITTQ